ncbi:site-specific integrase [Psychrobacillus lasiicapitis]|uniref:Site-specific integrase n=1 Tax=Psychrobacillus lasiicapitis TaxID=1636719 RepID=A0A544T1V0_9BACI|nr:site-specific integrase [Psychrobacillus lasiicapitis]TQR11434.1 site-specific integrase [Psychrobacillus lasiicapitis]GGA40569.1 site-specific integrase [Psychrobacillus lasiicapitis]
MAHIRKRGKTYSYAIDVGKDPLTGKRKQINKGGFIRKKDAEAAARKIELLLDENRYIVQSKEVFSEYIQYWFENYYQTRIKQASAINLKYIIEKQLICENPFANKEIAKITTMDIDHFYNLKLKEGYGTSYIRKLHQLLRQALSQAVKWKKIAINPVEDAAPPSVKYEEMSIWSFDAIQTFLHNCKGERHYLTFLLAIYTGMRRGEILGLQWSDIDFDKKVIHVIRSLSYVPKSGNVFTTLKTKNAKRQVPIPEFVLNELRIQKKRIEKWKELVGPMFEDQDLVICTNTGTSQDPRNVLRVMKRIVSNTKIPKIRFHDIRHTHASILISEGVDIVKISKRLGHANPKITLEFYAHLLPNEDNDIADIFHDAIQNKDKENEKGLE